MAKTSKLYDSPLGRYGNQLPLFWKLLKSKKEIPVVHSMVGYGITETLMQVVIKKLLTEDNINILISGENHSAIMYKINVFESLMKKYGEWREQNYSRLHRIYGYGISRVYFAEINAALLGTNLNYAVAEPIEKLTFEQFDILYKRVILRPGENNRIFLAGNLNPYCWGGNPIWMNSKGNIGHFDILKEKWINDPEYDGLTQLIDVTKDVIHKNFRKKTLKHINL